MNKLNESLLRPLPLFSKLTDPAIRSILDQATSRRYEPGTPVFQEGADADQFFLLLDGTLRVVRVTESGEQVTLLHVPAGQLFGIARALNHTKYPATAIAASEAIALAWPMRLWDEFSTQHEGFATETYKSVGHRMGEMSSRIVEMSTQHVEQRIARAMIRLIDQSGKKGVDGIEIDFPITRQDVSELTGTTLHTVSRLLSGWERDGLVKSQRKRITICDPQQLVALSGT